MEESDYVHQGSTALEAAEKSFYELLGEKDPPSSDNGQPKYHALNHSDSSCCTIGNNFVIHGWDYDLVQYESSNNAQQSTPVSIYSLLEGTCNIPETPFDSEFTLQSKRGFDNASKFLPKGDSLVSDWESNAFFVKEQEKETKNVVRKVDKEDGNLYSPDGLRAKKNPHSEDVNLEEGRSIKYTRKQSAASTESIVTQEMFDMTLLHSNEVDSVPCETAQNEKSKNVQPNGQSKGSINVRANRRKTGGETGVGDLRILLTLCAEAVAADDQRTATELLKQLRQHSSPVGDGMQRMAHNFANGLQARIAGSNTQIYKAIMTRRTSAADALKAYHLCYTAFPFIKLSARPGGPPKLRITGIDFSEPGFRPSQRVEDTGRRLANYAETFSVQFEFNAIAQKWDTIQIEDLNLDNNEVLVVNSACKLCYLLDETVVTESPRQVVLNLIRKMNPHVFIQAVVNAAYGGPFFTSRFQQALFHFSTFFEMLDTYLPRESPERMVIVESESCGRQAMNVIACEGSERIERPEAYKEWQLRNLRAGFRQLHLNQEMMNTAKDWLKSCYHKDFVIEENSQWLLQGWRG